MNELLKRQFGLRLERTSSRTGSKKGEKRDYVYEMHDIFDVANANNELNGINSMKPSLACWSVNNSHVSDEEILSCKIQNGYTIVQLGIAFDSWPCSYSGQRYRYESMKKQCLGNARERKKQKILHDIETEKTAWSMLSETEKQHQTQLRQNYDEDLNDRFEKSKNKSNNEKAKKREAKIATRKKHKRRAENALAKKKAAFIGYHPMGFFGSLTMN